MTIVNDFLTNEAYGYPNRGDRRRITPRVLAVVHITGNANNQGPNAADNERTFANRRGSTGPSAHYYINRDGSGIHAVDERRFAAWSNGDLERPNLSNKGVAYLVGLKASGKNANEGCYLEIELVGTATGAGQPTDEQMAVTADLIRAAAASTGLRINRETVLTHGDINSVDRPNCAFIKATREAQMARLIRLASEEPVPGLAFTMTDPTPGRIKVKNIQGVMALQLADREAFPFPPGAERDTFGLGRCDENIGGSGSPMGYLIGDELAVIPAGQVDYTPDTLDCSAPVGAQRERDRVAVLAAVEEVYAS